MLKDNSLLPQELRKLVLQRSLRKGPATLIEVQAVITARPYVAQGNLYAAAGNDASRRRRSIALTKVR